MLPVFILISYYHTYFDISSNPYVTSFPLLNFGFKKDSSYSLKLSNLTSEIIFGLATKKEIKKIKSTKYNQQNHQSQELLSNIQYLINNETEVNGKILSKSVLTPFIFPYKENYTLSLTINYKNGNNHLDYRCNIMMICMMIFSVLFFATEICFIFYWFRYEKSKNKFHIYIDLFITLISAINFSSFLLFNFSKNDEYFSGHNSTQSSFKVAISVLILASLLVASGMNFHFYNIRTFKKFKFRNFLSMLLYLLLSFVCLALILIMHIIDAGSLLFIFPAGFYMLFVLIQFNFFTTFSMTTFSIYFFFFGNFFTFALRSTLVNQMNESIGANVSQIAMDSITLVVQIISVCLMLIGYMHYHDHTMTAIDNNFVFKPHEEYTNFL